MRRRYTEPMTSARGFTFVELLVAAAIVAIALVGIAGMTPTAYRTVDWSGEDTMAVTAAKQQIEWLKNQPYTSAPLAAGTATENLVGNYVGYTRTTVVVDDPPALGVAGIKQVTVTVATPAGRSVRLVSVIAQ
jgi:prepilin-type N-terminal cleavage/methylation domain-containing protein